MAKVWLCRSGIVNQSCGPEPLAVRSVSECEARLGLVRSDYCCSLSEVGQYELPSTLPEHHGGVRLLMGHGTSYADCEHVVVIVYDPEGSDEWPPGVYRPAISCAEARMAFDRP